MIQWLSRPSQDRGRQLVSLQDSLLMQQEAGQAGTFGLMQLARAAKPQRGRSIFRREREKQR